MQAEHQRKERVRQEEARQAREKEEDKKRRKAAREAQKKLNELKRLKDEIHATYIVGGKGNESKEHMLMQDLVEIDGMNMGQPCIGVLGGYMGQMMVCFHTLHKYWQNEIDILNPRIVQNFLFLYIDAKMKAEKMVLQVGKQVEEFLHSLERPL